MRRRERAPSAVTTAAGQNDQTKNGTADAVPFLSVMVVVAISAAALTSAAELVAAEIAAAVVAKMAPVVAFAGVQAVAAAVVATGATAAVAVVFVAVGYGMTDAVTAAGVEEAIRFLSSLHSRSSNFSLTSAHATGSSRPVEACGSLNLLFLEWSCAPALHSQPWAIHPGCTCEPAEASPFARWKELSC